MIERQRKANEEAVRRMLALAPERMDPALIELVAGKVTEFLDRVGSSAPRMTGPDGEPLLRWEDRLIEEEIPEGASVLDLGCGDGDLLARLIRNKRVGGQGVELHRESVFRCVEKSVPVLQTDLDEGLSGFRDRSFDYVVLEETLQTLHRPVEVLNEMLRVGRFGIVSFPNFGYWRVRLDLVVRGQMPVTEWLPFRWYDSPNIHLFTLEDFQQWAADHSVTILKGYALAEGEVRPLRATDNLYAEEALLVVERNNA